MEKIKFGSKEVIAVVFATTLYVLVELLERYLMAGGIISGDFDYWIRLRIIIDILMAALFGPAVGVVSGVGGTLLVNVLYYGYISYVEVISFGVCGLLVGRYYNKLGILKGEFSGIRIIDFNVIQIISNLFCSCVIPPLMFFLIDGTNINESIRISFQIAFGSIVVTAILGSAILIIISKLVRRK